MSQQIVLPGSSSAICAFYDEYAGMLYGYIFEVVKNEQIAEQYLISVFNELPQHLHDITIPGVNRYHRLQQLTRKILAGYFETIPACGFAADDKSHLPARPNKFLERMTPEQQVVFCNIHYSGKSIAVLAAEMGKTETEVKKILTGGFCRDKEGNMSTDIAQYINSGMLEAYVIGAVSPEEEREILYLKHTYPEVRDALYYLEVDMEMMAASMAITPPPGTWNKIEAEIADLVARDKTAPAPFIAKDKNSAPHTNQQHFLEVESKNSYMRVHKSWKWVLAAIFILGKIFLAGAIYFYLENRQAQQQIQEYKTELKGLK